MRLPWSSAQFDWMFGVFNLNLCKMRPLAAILLGFVLLLVFQPQGSCTTGMLCNADTCSAQVSADCEEPCQNEQDENDCKGGCNPFQICATCCYCMPGNTTEASFLMEDYLLERSFVYRASVPMDLALDFWQPPRA